MSQNPWGRVYHNQPTRSRTDREWIVLAARSYRDRCARLGLLFRMPDIDLSEVNGEWVILRNDDFYIASYQLTDTGLRFVGPIAEEIEL